MDISANHANFYPGAEWRPATRSNTCRNTSRGTATLTTDPVVIAGYRFVYSFVSPTKYKVDAIPTHYNQTGVRSFALDQSGIVLDCDNDGKPCESDVPGEDEPSQNGE